MGVPAGTDVFVELDVIVGVTVAVVGAVPVGEGEGSAVGVIISLAV